MSRPTIRRGDSGANVVTVQDCLEVAEVDGDFGSDTERAVKVYQANNDLEEDGIVGPATWSELEAEFDLPPYPPPLPELDADMAAKICRLVEQSRIASFSWADRGQAPIGYSQGMALTFGLAVLMHEAADSSAIEMAKADTRDDDVDALSWYSDRFDELGMDNSKDGLDTLRHLFVLLLGLGMRESSGVFCCGKDQSASNTDAMTCEAGLFQMSWNASNSSDEMQKLFDQFAQAAPCPQCASEVFSENGAIDCNSADWQCYGSGDGYDYQKLAKNCPAFAAMTTAIGLRNIRQHWGPCNKFEIEVRPEANELFKAVQLMVTSSAVAS